MIVIIGALLLIFALAGCENEAPGADENQNGESAAVVNGEIIPLSQLQQQMEQVKMFYEQQGVDISDNPEEYEMLQEQILDTLIDQTLIRQEASNQDINVPQSDLDSAMERYKSQFGSEEEFGQALEMSGYTLDSFTKTVEKDLLVEIYQDRLTNGIEVTNEEIEEYYEVLKAQDHGEEELPKLDEVRDQIEQGIIEQKKNEVIQENLLELRESSEIEK
ncbi:parvulin-like peptidyl-prolyl isomerase [Desulfitispora alkaliphila]